jgi:hypothetical protein
MPPEPPVQIRINRNLVDQPPEEPESTETAGTNPIREPLAILILLLLSLCAVNLLKPDGDPDVWARLAVGKLIVESGAVPDRDPFSYTETRPRWIDHEWGAGVIFYGVASVGGQVGLLLLKAFLLFGTVLFMYLRSRRATGRPPSLLFHVFLLAALLFGFLASIRAQAFTFFFVSVWLYLLDRARHDDWRFAWLIPLSAVFWANVHGGFLAGIGFIILYAAGEIKRPTVAARFAGIAGLAGLASLINPYGLTYWSYLFEATTMARRDIPEWRPLNFLGPEVLYLGFKILVVLSVIALIERISRRDLPDLSTLLVLVVTAVLGFRVVRHLTFFVIASAPFIWTWLSAMWSQRARPWLSERAGGAVAPLAEASYYGISRGLLLVFALLTLMSTPMRIVLAEFYPVRAVDFIEQNQLKGNLLVPFSFGSYAIWRLYPESRVSLDGRYETVYTNATYDAVRNFFAGGPGGSKFLKQYPHDVILSPRNPRLDKGMSAQTEWAVAYEDRRYRVYVRADRQQEWPALVPESRSDPFATSAKARYAP